MSGWRTVQAKLTCAACGAASYVRFDVFGLDDLTDEQVIGHLALPCIRCGTRPPGQPSATPPPEFWIDEIRRSEVAPEWPGASS